MRLSLDGGNILLSLRGGGGPEKKLDIFGGDPKIKWKFSNFHPSPPLINDERSLSPINYGTMNSKKNGI